MLKIIAQIIAQIWVQLCYLYNSEEHNFLPEEKISVNTSLINTLLFVSGQPHVLVLEMKDTSGLCGLGWHSRYSALLRAGGSGD